jgi:2-keto-4-pentenoate hydratase
MTDAERLADRLLAAYDAGARVALPSAADPAFGLEEAYAVAATLRARRVARGEKPVGYKIGFTNRGIWARYGVYGPIWAPVWDTTLSFVDDGRAEVSLAKLVQPRLEPEVAFGFKSAPRAGMDAAELAGCLDWVAHSFEIVHTHYDDWRFAAADSVADFGLHVGSSSGRACRWRASTIWARNWRRCRSNSRRRAAASSNAARRISCSTGRSTHCACGSTRCWRSRTAGP